MLGPQKKKKLRIILAAQVDLSAINLLLSPAQLQNAITPTCNIVLNHMALTFLNKDGTTLLHVAILRLYTIPVCGSVQWMDGKRRQQEIS